MDIRQRGPTSVRNPLLGLPATRALLELLKDQPEVGQQLINLLKQLGIQADSQAERSWKQRKAPNLCWAKALLTTYKTYVTFLVSFVTENKGDVIQ